MYVHKEAKLVFLANPRTGSTSVAKALMEIGFEQDGTHHSARDIDGYTTFAVVRNHWDAAVSWVFGKHLGEYKDLDFTVETFEFALDNEYVTEHEMWGYHKPDLVVRFEGVAAPYPLSMEEQINFILAPGVGYHFSGPPKTIRLGVCKLDAIALQRANVSTVRNGRHYREFYTDETRDYIGNRFKDEIERLGYEF